MKRIAQFEKVSIDNFVKSWTDEFSTDSITAENIYNGIALPKRATSGSAGYDIYSPVDFVIKPGETVKIPTGIRCRIDDGWVLKIYPRSGLGFKYRLQLNNTVGIIDADYYNSSNEGHIMIKLSCDAHDERHRVELSCGDGFAQGIFTQFGITVDDSADGIRDGGFGSTSKGEK